MHLFLHYGYWSLIFLVGIFEVFGLPSGIYKLGIPAVGIVLFVVQLSRRKQALKLPFWQWVAGFIAVALISISLNAIDYFSFIYFLTYTLLSYIYFLVIINEAADSLVRKVKRFVIGLILLQIPAAFIKFFLLGQSEKGGIGTLSVGAGSLSTVFPVLIIAFLVSYYLFTRKQVFLLLIFLFLVFGLIGGKRAIVFFIPCEVVVGYIMYIILLKKKITPRVIRTMVAIPCIGAFLFYFSVKTNPTLNREHSGWGSFDLEYVIDYSKNYNQTDDDNEAEVSRQDGLVLFTLYILNADPAHMLIGDGAGKLVESKYKESSGSMLEEYGVRYGGRMGFIWILLQVGVLGAVLFFGTIIRLNLRLLRYRKQRRLSASPLFVGFIIATLFMLFDTIIYSSSFARYEVIKGVYFFAAALLYREYYHTIHTAPGRKRSAGLPAHLNQTNA